MARTVLLGYSSTVVVRLLFSCSLITSLRCNTVMYICMYRLKSIHSQEKVLPKQYHIAQNGGRRKLWRIDRFRVLARKTLANLNYSPS